MVQLGHVVAVFWVEYEWIDELMHGLLPGEIAAQPQLGHLTVEVQDVPTSEMGSGAPSTHVIWQAEQGFLDMVRDHLPAAAIVTAWRIYWRTRQGRLVSEYRLHYLGAAPEAFRQDA